MIHIRCEDTRGNYERFVIPDVNTIDELKEYADKNLPIKCFRMGSRHKSAIYIEEEFETVYLYLNQYAFYKQIHPYIMRKDEFERLTVTQCTTCALESRDYGWYCSFKNSESDCSNYEKKIYWSLWEWIRNKLQRRYEN
ncbi:hypothetical protein GCM10023310_69150 [Paenibacillus vulneris]|uniref:Uncharacterized protein n=1 Tax=Paenibacillus vulneris TaxID=1133364 RepID=A0ABW3UJ75_9BACL